MSDRRLLLSLVVALSFTTLASADPTTVNMTSLRSGTGTSGAANTRFTSNSRTPTPASMMSVANNGSTLTAANGNTRLSGPPFGKVMYHWNITASASTRIPSARLHANFRLRTPKWNIADGGHGLSTPEPASLLLLSTGLIGIAGLVRRKLRA